MNNVRLYGFENCPYCKEIRTKFDEGGIDYIYVDIESEFESNERKLIFK